MLDFASSVVDLLKKIAVFSLSIFCPDQASYSSKSLAHYDNPQELTYRIASYNLQKNKWVSFGPCLHKEKPLISPILAECFMRA